jgi:hypothetical protein
MPFFLLQAELQLNFQKRRGHGLLSIIRPKFSGVLGEALDIAARWSGDVVSFSFRNFPCFLSCLDPMGPSGLSARHAPISATCRALPVAA